jgi:hypothetical protein
MLQSLFPNFDEMFASIDAQIAIESALIESVVKELTFDMDAFRAYLSGLHDQLTSDAESAFKELTSYTDSLLADFTCDMTSTLAVIAELSAPIKYWSLIN